MPLLLPRPMVNIASGGAHGAGAIDIQDVLAVSLTATAFAEAIQVASRVRAGTAWPWPTRGCPPRWWRTRADSPARSTATAPPSTSSWAGIERGGLEPGVDVGVTVDVAATQLFDGKAYRLRSEGRTVDPGGWMDEVAGWCATHPIVSLEDPLAEDDRANWAELTRRLDRQRRTVRQVIGNELFATNLGRVRRGVAAGAATKVLVKPDQAGTLSRTFAVLDHARNEGLGTVLSARSGDTEDSWPADLAVGPRAGQIKVGSTTRSERTARWNRLLEIEALSDRPTELAAFP